MRNLRLEICYDGTRYRGWQRLQGKDDTIQGKLETALSRILNETIEINGSGRTDAGVHAKGQVANFHCESAMPAQEILQNLRRYLPEDACYEEVWGMVKILNYVLEADVDYEIPPTSLIREFIGGNSFYR